MKILVIRFSSIGDIVLTTPVVRCLKNQLGEAEIHYLTKPTFRGLLESNPYISKVHVLDGTIAQTASRLKAEKFDYLVDLHHNLRTALLKTRLGVRSFSFNKLNLQKWLLVKLKINTLPPVHIVDRYLETVSSLGVSNDGAGLDYFFSKEHTVEDLLPPAHQPGYTAFAIGGQHATKRLPPDKLIAVCRLIEGPVVLLGGKEDMQTAAAIIAAGGNDHVFDLCGRISLEESAFLVRQSARVITHDTGLMHIAAAFNKPITSVWGNTVPEFGMYPYRVDRSRVVEYKGLYCRPCSKIGYEKCPLGHFRCMNELDPAGIAASPK